MKRPLAHQIDSAAQPIFEGTIPRAWVCSKQQPDYAKDYLVEIGEGDVLTGVNFFVQLKGQEKIKYSADKQHATFSLESKYAAYYLDKVTQPAFLVVVDVNARVGYWVFMQQYIAEKLKGTAWKKKKSVTIYLPVKNRLGDTDKLRKAVEAAREYMTARHPASLENSLAAKREKLESLDPRFKIRLDVVNEQERYWLNPIEPVELQVVFHGKPDELSRKIEDMIGRGLPTTFGAGEVEVVGSALFAEMVKDGIIFHSENIQDCTLSLVALSAQGGQLVSLDAPGKLAAARLECRFDGGLEHTPFEIHITAPTDGKESTIRMGFDARRWFGQPLLMLAYFEQLFAFFGRTRECESVDLKCLWRGNVLFRGNISGQGLAPFKTVGWFLSAIQKARSIAEREAIRPTFNEEIDKDKAEDIDILYDLVHSGEFRARLLKGTLTCDIGADKVPGLLNLPESDDGGFKVESLEEQRRQFFGHEINVGRVEIEYSHMKRVSTNSDLLKEASETKTGKVKLRLEATAATEHIVRKLPPSLAPPSN